MPTRTKHMDEISEELEALQSEVAALGLKQDKIQDQMDLVNNRLQTVDSLEKQLGKVELLVENNSKVHQEIFNILREMRSENPSPPSPVSQAETTVVVPQRQNQPAQPETRERELANQGTTVVQQRVQQFQGQSSGTARNEGQQAPTLGNTAVQYQSDRAIQFMKSISKGPKLDFPSFSGENPLGWIRQVNKYFQLAQTPDECKVDLALTYIIGRADNWVRSAQMDNKALLWQEFCRALCYRFADSSIYEVLEKFHNLKQNTLSVAAYTDKFEEIMAVVRDEHPYLQENYYIVSFVNGLKPSIRCNLRPQRPTTLSQAYWLARDYESGLQAKYQSYQDKQLQYHSSQQHKATIPAAPNLHVPQAAPATKKPGVCWRCNGPWAPGHKCKQAPAIHAITGENEITNLSPGEEAQLAVLAAEGHLTETTADCMHISAQAVSGNPSSSTLAAHISIGGRQGVASTDTGSTNTFIDLKFALKVKCPLINTPTKKVTVAGGGSLTSGACAQSLKFRIGQETFCNDLTVLELQGYDVVIGCDMLKKHSPISMDFEERTVTFTKDKATQVTFPDCTSTEPPKVITAEKMDKILDSGAVGFAMSLHFMTTGHLPLVQEEHTPEDILQVLEQYKGQFQEPTELPPKRECDHAIPLKENSTPPNVRPYRVPHLQKNEME
uniref:Ty3 transposon capsid-like protein domain-containing protein n=1 Tax=Aegilops tauschii subsp. strangulata TaxID=200361 RepID=A0A453IPF2_AEGTS